MIPQWTSCSERWARVDTSWLAKINSRSDLATYLALCSRANGQTRDAWPAKATIAKDAGIAPEEVRRSLRELEKLGAIKTNTRFFSGEQTSSQYTIQESVTDGRFAFVAAPWIARIETLNALRLFVALCSCANHEDSVVRGYSRDGLAQIAGFRPVALTRALPHLVTIGAIAATISTTGSKTAYVVRHPPEAFAGDSNLENRELRMERLAQLRRFVAKCRKDGTTFRCVVERGIATIAWKPMTTTRTHEMKRYVADLPWCLIYVAIGSTDGAANAHEKAA